MPKSYNLKRVKSDDSWRDHIPCRLGLCDFEFWLFLGLGLGWLPALVIAMIVDTAVVAVFGLTAIIFRKAVEVAETTNVLSKAEVEQSNSK